MIKSIKTYISIILALVMILGTLASCSPGSGNDETSGTSSSTEATGSEDGSSSDTNSSTQDTDGNDGSETESDTTETEAADEIELEGIYGPSIVNATSVANAVQSYYTSADRSNYVINNANMSLEYSLDVSGDSKPGLKYINNSKGGTYIENTMDVFIKMMDGNTYYASSSNAKARPNIYRLGYYYYDVHFLNQNFIPEIDEDDIKAEEPIDIELFKNTSAGFTYNKLRKDERWCLVAGSDAFIYMNGADFSFFAVDYNAIQFTIKTPSGTKGSVYFLSEGDTGHTNAKKADFSVINNNEYQTYTVYLGECSGFEGDIYGLRVDIDDATKGDIVIFKDFKLVNIDVNAPSIVLDRTFHTYSDKLHQELHFVAKKDTYDIESLGMITDIQADRVEKLVVKADGELYTDIAKVKDWSTAEYVGFDIKDVGIFGYILASHDTSGTIKVTLDNGVYSIIQETSPDGDAIFAPVKFTENDFRMGQRIYTDESHTFDAFIDEAEFERAPSIGISSKNYVEYDALRGAFTFNIDGVGFNEPYYFQWNKHYKADISIKTRTDRKLYVRTIFNGGTLEGAALLDSGGLLLPIPLEVSKNFGSEDEEPIFNNGDQAYSETLFPLELVANNQYDFTVVNVYQNWGNYPIKQLSSIQYYAPYYHLSTGVTESSCIAPWYNDHGRNLWTLPDFRSMSAPLWDNQPQHSHGGYHTFLEYTDADGNYNASENYSNVIGSAGLTYSEVLMSYISDDGKIKVEYNHIEFPQNDEMRANYEIRYEILEDVSFDNFKEDFAFYSTKCYGGTFQTMGYLNKDNQVTHTKTANEKTPTYFVLGDLCPYVSFYDIKLNKPEDTWVNVGFVIHSSDITIGGESFDGNFVIKSADYKYSLSLDLETVTLKKGDVITLNMIIVPWGHPESVDDQNMQNVRLDSCLKPLSVDVTKGEKIESAFVPRVRATDGKSAEFTISGGANNVAVRVYGFEKLTAPKIQELVNGEWVDYKVNSIDSPDLLGYSNYYDGYFTYYDSDGTYSYSFVTNMTETAEDGTVTHLGERTFRISAVDDFVPWPEKDDAPTNNSPFEVFASPTDLLIYTEKLPGVGKVELSNDTSYISIYGDDNEVREVYFTLFKQSKSSDMQETGRYLIVKYRIPTTNNTNPSTIEFFLATYEGSTGGAITGTGDHVAFPTIVDNNWHIAIIDLKNNKSLPSYVESEDGKYYASNLRFDLINGDIGVNDRIDYAYVCMTDDLENLYSFDSEAKDISYNPLSGGGNSGGTPAPKPEENKGYIDDSSGYHKSELAYSGNVDFINGLGESGASEPFAGKASSSVHGPVVIPHYSSTVKGTSILCFAGWTVVESCAAKYMWSADGGKTWHDAYLYNRAAFSAASTPMIESANARVNKDLSAYAEGANFGGSVDTPSGVAADLSDYMGETVDVTFAAVPNDDPMGLCVVLHVLSVSVPDEDGNVSGETYDGVSSDFIDPSSKYLSATVPYASAIDYVNGAGPDGDVDKSFGGKFGSKGTPAVIAHNSTSFTSTDGKEILYIGGWCLVTGGFEKFVWSADGGKTWNDAFLYGFTKLGNSGEAIISSAITRSGDGNIGYYADGSNFQSKAKGIAADLSAYEGQTVDVMFAAVPKFNPDTVCLVVSITGVTVTASAE